MRMKTSRYAVLVSLLILLLPLFAVAGQDKSGVSPQVISLPSGPGSIEGLGESFEPELNTGSAPFGVAFTLSPGVAGHTPALRLTYNSGYGNTPVGLGWNLNIEYIQRQTDKGLPEYTNNDTFLVSGGGELVPLPDSMYRQKIEGSFIRYKKTTDGWEAWRPDGTRLFFGTEENSRQQNNRGTFAWFLQREVDTNGNAIEYLYEHDQGMIYLSEIRYSMMSPSLYKAVRLLYEDRPDVLTDYISRSKVVQARRLQQVKVLSAGTLVRSYRLDYHTTSFLSLLASVTQFGTDGTTTLPPLSFNYSVYDHANQQTVVMSDPPPYGTTLENLNTDLVDINGDALPDMVYTDSYHGKHRFYINAGRGSWNPTPTIPDSSPAYTLSTDGVMMSDMNGDGRSDLFIKNSFNFGFYKNTGAMKWETADWQPCSPNPGFSFESQEIRLLDVNNDKLIDVLMDRGSSYAVWLNRPDNVWNNSFDFQTWLPDGNYLSLSASSTKIGDMNGDRM
ncbi:MAG: hypothetical protein D3917_12485, partial [Candidatus Electrothrix sp. AX5]|nr:hypothetical protein [Candidatus Electrothrix sp. AX5]